MQRAVLLWAFIGTAIAILTTIKAVGVAYPAAQDSIGLLLGTTTAIVVAWGVLRCGALEEHFPEVLRATGWLLLAWSAIGWWSVAAEAGALGASLFFFPGGHVGGLCARNEPRAQAALLPALA